MQANKWLVILLIALAVISLSPYASEWTDFGSRIDGFSVLDSRATSQTASLSLFIKCELRDILATGGEVNFTPECPNTVTNVTGLNPSWTTNLTGYDYNVYPDEWSEPEPTFSEVETILRAFELNVSGSTTGTYTVYFELPIADLPGIGVDDTHLFIYDSDWTRLNTTVEDESGNPIRFSAVTTHFSKFIIGELEVAEESPGDSGGGGSGGGGSGGSGGGGGGGGFSGGGPTFDYEPDEVPPGDTTPPRVPTKQPKSITKKVGSPLERIAGLVPLDTTSTSNWFMPVSILIILFILMIYVAKRKVRAPAKGKDKSEEKGEDKDVTKRTKLKARISEHEKAIIDYIRSQGELDANAVALRFQMSRSNASLKLNKLYDLGLLNKQYDNKTVYYRTK